MILPRYTHLYQSVKTTVGSWCRFEIQNKIHQKFFLYIYRGGWDRDTGNHPYYPHTRYFPTICWVYCTIKETYQRLAMFINLDYFTSGLKYQSSKYLGHMICTSDSSTRDHSYFVTRFHFINIIDQWRNSMIACISFRRKNF